MKKELFTKNTSISLLLLILFSCSDSRITNSIVYKDQLTTTYSGKVYLYGESHGVERILKKEYELWKDYYNRGMRHLFVELPYYTAEFLNIWMKAEDDTILLKLQKNSEGTASDTPHTLEFYRKIKKSCPDTIFHGTDLGHQYDTIGEDFLKYLEEQNLIGTENHTLTKAAIKQGKIYYKYDKDPIYRENKMVENFIRELDKVGNTDIMGIYGAAHTGITDNNFTNEVINMANQLNMVVPAIESTDLGPYKKITAPLRVDIIEINGKSYTALYFGRQDLNGFNNYEYREFWLVEEAYSVYNKHFKTKDFLPTDNYPMKITTGNLYRVLYKDLDGKESSSYYISTGKKWKGRVVTESISILDKNFFEYIKNSFRGE